MRKEVLCSRPFEGSHWHECLSESTSPRISPLRCSGASFHDWRVFEPMKFCSPPFGTCQICRMVSAWPRGLLLGRKNSRNISPSTQLKRRVTGSGITPSARSYHVKPTVMAYEVALFARIGTKLLVKLVFVACHRKVLSHISRSRDLCQLLVKSALLPCLRC